MPYPMQRLAALVLSLVLSPLLVVVALILRIRQGSPVIYWGERYGQHGKIFRQCKFRTMVNDADSLLDESGLTAVTQRVTAVGAVLRRTSIDELPQLLNVLRGEMALVGPRPMIDLVYARVDSNHPRFDVLPGITGLAQINGRNDVPWSERLDMDADYVATRSFKVDVNILFQTIAVTALRRGVAADRNAENVLDL